MQVTVTVTATMMNIMPIVTPVMLLMAHEFSDGEIGGADDDGDGWTVVVVVLLLDEQSSGLLMKVTF